MMSWPLISARVTCKKSFLLFPFTINRKLFEICDTSIALILSSNFKINFLWLVPSFRGSSYFPLRLSRTPRAPNFPCHHYKLTSVSHWCQWLFTEEGHSYLYKLPHQLYFPMLMVPGGSSPRRLDMLKRSTRGNSATAFMRARLGTWGRSTASSGQAQREKSMEDISEVAGLRHVPQRNYEKILTRLWARCMDGPTEDEWIYMFVYSLHGLDM